jgi:DNA-binding NarL/FixJ family response regulator
VKKLMNIMVVDNSKIVRDRIAKLLDILPDVRVNSFDVSEYKYGHACEKVDPHILILSAADASPACLSKFKNLKKENPELLGIVLSNRPYKEYEIKWRKAGAEFYFDKSTEFKKILDVCGTTENIV